MSLLRPHRLLAVALFCSVAAAAASDSGDRYRVTSTMRMAGMSMPGTTTEVCTARAQPVSEQSIPKEKDCAVQNFRVQGNKASYRIVCTGKNAMTGDGEMETLADGYRGSINAQVEGQQISMSYQGKRIGGCDYATESPEAQGKAITAQVCEAQITSVVSHAMYVGPKAACPTYKARFCANVNREMAQVADPARFADTDRKYGSAVWQAAEGCGGSRAAILAKACASAESGGNLDFVGDYCPERVAPLCAAADPNRNGRFVARHCAERARTLAAQHCDGRGYTAMNASPYRAFCSSYAAERLNARNAGAASAAAGGPAPAAGNAPEAETETDEAAPAKKPSFRDRLKGLKDRIGGN